MRGANGLNSHAKLFNTLGRSRKFERCYLNSNGQTFLN